MCKNSVALSLFTPSFKVLLPLCCVLKSPSVTLSLSVKLLFPLAFLSKYLKTKLLKTLRLLHYGMQLQRINSNAKHFFPFLFLNYSELVITNLSPLVLQWHWRTGYPVARTGAVITTMPARRRELQRSRYPRGSCFFRWVRARHVLPADIHLFYCTLLQ